MALFRRTVRSYFRREGRQLPWRPPLLAWDKQRDRLDPYSILVSEVMLQQTQVDRVVPKYREWLEHLPDFRALQRASVAEVLRLWQGLGYNRRALALKRSADIVVADWAGELPTSEEALRTLPGVGAYTAAAIRAFAFNIPVIMVETNIRSVFIQAFFSHRKSVADNELVPLIEQSLDREDPRRWYWALMDYGAHLKRTTSNPGRQSKEYVRQSTFEGSNRQLRGLVVRTLTQRSRVSWQRLLRDLDDSPQRVKLVLAQLEREGFIRRGKTYIMVAR